MNSILAAVLISLGGVGFIIITGIIYSWWVTRKDSKKSKTTVKA